MTTQEAQDLRKKGFTVVMNNSLKKVLLVTQDENKAENLRKNFLNKNKIVKVFYPLIKTVISRKDQEEALKNLRLGLNCNF